MEEFENNFSSKLKILSLVAVLISLSVPTTATEPRKCYWCGPLAEQVHKSTRAPACNEANAQITACDPGFTHCAVVATSPPYTESRFCVKLYQDECYSVYCNSTKIWRMTCPCLGDLCNGPNTQREKDAFLILTKLVDKSQNARNKRTLISTPNSISNKKFDTINNSNETEMNVTTNKNNHIADNNEKPTEANNETIGADIKTTERSIDIIKIEVTQIMDKDEQNTENNDQKSTFLINIPHQPIDNTVPTILSAQVTPAVKHEESTRNDLPYPSKELPTEEALKQNVNVNENAAETTATVASVKYTKQEIEIPDTTPQIMNNIVSSLSAKHVTAAITHEESESLPHLSEKSPILETLHQNTSLTQNIVEIKESDTSVKNTSQKIEAPASTTSKTQDMDDKVSTKSAVKHEESMSTNSPHLSKEPPTAESLEQNIKLNEKVIDTKVSETTIKNILEEIKSTTSKTVEMNNMVSTNQPLTSSTHEESPHPSKELPTAQALQQITSLNQKVTETKVAETANKNTSEEIKSTIYKTEEMNNKVSTKEDTAAVKHEESPHPSKELPTAKALQQNASVANHEKVTEPTVTESPKTTLSTMHEIKTTEKITLKKNTGTKMNNHILTLVSAILLHRYL